VLGAISMDMMAVLLGGTTALLPIFARDILFVDEVGLGLLRSAPSVGAAIVAIAFARWPLTRHVGKRMFACVAVFGMATIVFGLSQNFVLSLAALAILGAADQVSVVIRSTLVQLATPDAMRGRVSSVNFLFIGTSNELGEFRSGVTAGWFGVIPAVIIGGVGTLAVVAGWLKLFPSLRKIDRFSDAMETVEMPAEPREKLLQG
jgi:MFS family permease